MTPRPSQLSVQNAGEKAQRRLQVLAALDIDVWSVRAAAAARQAPAAKPAAPVRQAPAGSGPAAARAVLAESAKVPGAANKATSRAPTEPEVALGSSPDAVIEVTGDASADAAKTAAPRLDLLCLSSDHGLLLVPQTGLSPQARRLLQDILASATRVIASRLLAATQADVPTKSGRSRLQSLRFTWPLVPEAGQHQAPGSQPDSGDTARALRGFLNRQLKDKAEPMLLYVAPEIDHDTDHDTDLGIDLAELLAQVELPIVIERRVSIEAPERLMSDSTLKRALWQTLSAL